MRAANPDDASVTVPILTFRAVREADERPMDKLLRITTPYFLVVLISNHSGFSRLTFSRRFSRSRLVLARPGEGFEVR